MPRHTTQTYLHEAERLGADTRVLQPLAVPCWRASSAGAVAGVGSTQFGMRRLEQTVLEMRGNPAREVVDHVITRVAEFAKGAPQSDDITCVAVVRNEP